MKKLLMLLSIILLCSCGMEHEVRVDIPDVKVEVPEVVIDVPTEFTFGPNFQAWYDYCRGKVEHKNKKKDWNLTEEEILFKTEDCYYSLDIDLPELPQIEDI